MPKAAPTTKAANVANFCLLVAAIAATLWDFRLFGLRIFDGVAIASLAAWMFLSMEPSEGFLEGRRRYWVLFGTVGIYCIAGFLLHGHRSSVAIIVLAAIAFALIGRTDWIKTVAPLLWKLVAIHAFFFIIQYTAFYGFGLIVDYQEMVGGQSRILRAAWHMRVAGLFQEPNSYCLNMLVITSLAIFWKPHRVLTFSVAITMLLSESLWGIGAAALLLILSELRLQTSVRKLLSTLAISFVALALLFNGYVVITKSKYEDQPYFYYRMSNILKDPSLKERYLSNKCQSQNHNKKQELWSTKRISIILLGNGLSTSYFEECLPANGLSLLFKSFGLLGLATLCFGFAIALGGLSYADRFYIVATIGFSMTSYPLFTYLIFWLWLAIMFGLLRIKKAGSVLSDASTLRRA